MLTNSGPAPVSRRPIMRSVILFLEPIEMRTKYALCPVTAKIEYRFSYSNGETFVLVFSKFSSPFLLCDLIVGKCVSSSSLSVKDLDLLLRGP